METLRTKRASAEGGVGRLTVGQLIDHVEHLEAVIDDLRRRVAGLERDDLALGDA